LRRIKQFPGNFCSHSRNMHYYCWGNEEKQMPVNSAHAMFIGLCAFALLSTPYMLRKRAFLHRASVFLIFGRNNIGDGVWMFGWMHKKEKWKEMRCHIPFGRASSTISSIHICVEGERNTGSCSRRRRSSTIAGARPAFQTC